MDLLAEKSLRWGLLAVAVLIIIYRQRQTLDRFALAREFALVVCAYLAYFGVRGATVGSEAQALANAERIINLERQFGIFLEPSWQQIILPYQHVVDLMNWIYIWGHWPLIGLVAAWLYTRHQSKYRLFRNAFLVSGGIGLVMFATFPVAPPRLTDLEVVDTITVHSRSYRLLQPPGFVNQYAAMPSLHFGWNMLIGISLMMTVRHWLWKMGGALVPVAMFLAVILTANHYILDAVVGGAVAASGLVLAGAPSIVRRTARSYANAYR